MGLFDWLLNPEALNARPTTGGTLRSTTSGSTPQAPIHLNPTGQASPGMAGLIAQQANPGYSPNIKGGNDEQRPGSSGLPSFDEW